MDDFIKMENFLKAFASTTRLEILSLIQVDVNNPTRIARKMNRHRSTIEKHLRVLLESKAVKKVPALTKTGGLFLTYELEENAKILLKTLANLIVE